MSPESSPRIIKGAPNMHQLSNLNHKAEAAAARKHINKKNNTYTMLLHDAKKI